MKSLLDAAKRPKVQSELTVVLRRLETNLAKLLDSSKASPAAATTTNTNGSSARQPYDIPYKNYCESEIIFVNAFSTRFPLSIF